jgi:hypothetical protein
MRMIQIPTRDAEPVDLEFISPRAINGGGDQSHRFSSEHDAAEAAVTSGQSEEAADRPRMTPRPGGRARRVAERRWPVGAVRASRMPSRPPRR